eukprot:gene9345-10330_t
MENSNVKQEDSTVEERNKEKLKVASVEEEMASLKEEMSRLSKENSNLGKEKNRMQEIVEFLQFAQDSTVEERSKEKLKVASMEEEMASLKKEISILSKENSNLEKEKKGMQEMVEFLQFGLNCRRKKQGRVESCINGRGDGSSARRNAPTL